MTVLCLILKTWTALFTLVVKNDEGPGFIFEMEMNLILVIRTIRSPAIWDGKKSAGIIFIQTRGHFVFTNGLPVSRVLILNSGMVTLYKTTLHD